MQSIQQQFVKKKCGIPFRPEIQRSYVTDRLAQVKSEKYSKKKKIQLENKHFGYRSPQYML